MDGRSRDGRGMGVDGLQGRLRTEDPEHTTLVPGTTTLTTVALSYTERAGPINK